MNLQHEFHPVPKPSKSPKVKKPMKKRVTKRAKAKEFTESTKQVVRTRSGAVCEICKQRPGVHFHHAVYRSHIQGEAARDISNCLLVCMVCHEVCHSTRAMREYAVHLAKELAGK